MLLRRFITTGWKREDGSSSTCSGLHALRAETMTSLPGPIACKADGPYRQGNSVMHSGFTLHSASTLSEWDPSTWDLLHTGSSSPHGILLSSWDPPRMGSSTPHGILDSTLTSLLTSAQHHVTAPTGCHPYPGLHPVLSSTSTPASAVPARRQRCPGRR